MPGYKAISGIYKIENKINHKVYIGQSVNIKRRWSNHRQHYKNPKDKGYDYYLYRSMRKYGIKNFSFEILEVCPPSLLNERERYYINKYDSFFNGYNNSLGGESKITSANLKERIIGIFKDLEDSNLTHGEIAKKYDISAEMVQGINTGRHWFCENKSYPIRKYRLSKDKKMRLPLEPNIKRCTLCGKKVYGEKVTVCRNCRLKDVPPTKKKKSKSTNFQYPAYSFADVISKEELDKMLRDNNGNFTKVAKRLNVSTTTIRRICILYDMSVHSIDYSNLTPLSNFSKEDVIKSLHECGNITATARKLNTTYDRLKIYCAKNDIDYKNI